MLVILNNQHKKFLFWHHLFKATDTNNRKNVSVKIFGREAWLSQFLGADLKKL
jgi:hypothetical protein